MRICFYCLGAGHPIPAQDYLENKFGKNYDLLPTIKTENQLSKIMSVWKFAIERRGVPTGQIIDKCSGYDYLDIRIKMSRLLIRFPFYGDIRNERIVLLNGFEKIEGYKSGGKTDRYATRMLDDAQIYYNNYNKNNNLFVEIPIILSQKLI